MKFKNLVPIAAGLTVLPQLAKATEDIMQQVYDPKAPKTVQDELIAKAEAKRQRKLERNKKNAKA